MVSLSHSYASKKDARRICLLTAICGDIATFGFGAIVGDGDLLRECTRRSEGLEIR